MIAPRSLELSLATVVGASPLLGHDLEDRAPVRDAQDATIVREVAEYSRIRLRGASQRSLFIVAPVDLLVSECSGRNRFHPIELNGTGIGGLTNLTPTAVGAVLNSFTECARDANDHEALFLIASSGKESDATPRKNRLIYEKLLYAEALRRGFGDDTAVVAMPQSTAADPVLPLGRPTVVLGYIKDYLNRLSLDAQGRLTLAGRIVTGLINDRFALNVIDRFGGRVDLRQLTILNQSFLAGADKGVAYDLLNKWLAESPNPLFPPRIEFRRAACRTELVDSVFDKLREGQRVLIKPRGTGVGHGIEFFLKPDEPPATVVARIDRSIRATEEFYAAAGGAFPYTVCDFVDTRTVQQPGHPLDSRKFELRIVVYRDGDDLLAFPSIAKVAACRFDALTFDGTGLINNITASTTATGCAGTDYMLPLSNRQTLDLLGLSIDEIAEASRGLTSYVRSILDACEDRPEQLGLPAAPREATWPLLRAA